MYIYSQINQKIQECQTSTSFNSKTDGGHLHTCTFLQDALHLLRFLFNDTKFAATKLRLALCKELVQRKEYLDSESVETIYFGGGTPSQLSYEELTAIFQTITENYRVTENAEVTMEANPDDLSSTYLSLLRKLPFNRISMGIQTFHDGTLKLLKRRHSALQALEAFKKSRVAGFNNISIDLMYGLPGESIQTWKEDINKAISLSPEHISAYHLTYEQGTPIYNMLQQHKIREVTEELSVTFFNILREELLKSGYEHYEISNFCQPGKESKHNTSYWKGVNYLGCGPSAHSFNGKSREWNVSSLIDYIKGIEKGKEILKQRNSMQTPDTTN